MKDGVLTAADWGEDTYKWTEFNKLKMDNEAKFKCSEYVNSISVIFINKI